MTLKTLSENVSVQFSHSVVSDSLQPHESQHARPPCPSPTPGVHSNSCPSSWWCHPAISSSVVPFSSCTQSLPASESFPMSQLFAWKCVIPLLYMPGHVSNIEYYTIPKHPIEKCKTIELLGEGGMKLEYASFLWWRWNIYLLAIYDFFSSVQ